MVSNYDRFCSFNGIYLVSILGIPVGNRMSKYGRKNTVLASMAVTVVGMFLPLLVYSSVTCVIAYVLLGIGNAIITVSL